MEKLCSEHCAMEKLPNTNILSVLSISKAHGDELLKLFDFGKDAMNRAGVRFLPELRIRASNEELARANARKVNRMEYFTEQYKARLAASDKKRKSVKARRKSSQAVTTIWKNRFMELKNCCDVRTSAESTEAENEIVRQRTSFLYENVDLKTVLPEAFLDSTGENPKKPLKSKFWQKLQEEIGASGEQFLLCGYPDLRQSTVSQSLVY